ncbi:hypothetical protein AN958_08597 [Leucoagaricus sp. SymC.cos]|nr:hypothetical protein AN958_08597 [Leucoagaricus sp. SymC.cos]
MVEDVDVKWGGYHVKNKSMDAEAARITEKAKAAYKSAKKDPGVRNSLKVMRDVYLDAGYTLVKWNAQANDGMKYGWYENGEQLLKKKGAGHGIHQSDVICTTVGWMKDASETPKYGKAHEGYWNGELFVKQLHKKIIPTFEQIHGPGYQALIIVDNSQGHYAYAKDALVASQMNLWPGGKQAFM